MCGITGTINFKKNINKSLFVKMNNIIEYRGPNDEGYALINDNNIIEACGKDSHKKIKEKLVDINNLKDDYPIIFGHRRLSILDLSEKGHQPMSDNSNNIVITYNGEIYNYVEIRNELMKKNYKFYTNSDTEVIINAYKEWGYNCVNHFNGMWSFAIYDRKKSTIFCSRDRFGVKPFYYYYDEEKIVFGSEVKQIIEDKSIKRIANDEVIYNFLAYGVCDYNEKTFFKNIYALSPSTNMIITIDFKEKKYNIDFKKYYFIENKKYKRNEEQYINLFKREFDKSIKLRLRSDTEVGSCLSGGLDSSAIVTIACKNLKKKNKHKLFQTFTACYDENKEIDERYYSKKVVKKCGCKENLIYPSKSNIEDDLKNVIWHQDFPFASLSIYSQWNVMNGANKKNIKVLLDGQGSDEILFGYERYAIFLLKNDIKHFRFINLIKNYQLLKLNANINIKKIIAYLLYFSNNALTRNILYSSKKKYICKKFKDENRKNNDYLNNINFKNAFNLNITDIYYLSLGPLLRYEDRNSMAFSIESRVPFLDYNIIELSLNIPINYRINGGWTKSILRKSMKNEMDEEVVFRKNKIGFASPQKDWLNKIDDKFINKYLSIMKTKKYFDIERIKKIFENKENETIRWYFLCLEIWFEVYNVTVEK